MLAIFFMKYSFYYTMGPFSRDFISIWPIKFAINVLYAYSDLYFADGVLDYDDAVVGFIIQPIIILKNSY